MKSIPGGIYLFVAYSSTFRTFARIFSKTVLAPSDITLGFHYFFFDTMHLVRYINKNFCCHNCVTEKMRQVLVMLYKPLPNSLRAYNCRPIIQSASAQVNSEYLHPCVILLCFLVVLFLSQWIFTSAATKNEYTKITKCVSQMTRCSNRFF